MGVRIVPSIVDPESRRFNRLDAVWLAIWLIFLAGLAVLPPQFEWHKQLILLAIGIVQLLESRLISYFPKRGVAYVILLKILLATLLIVTVYLFLCDVLFTKAFAWLISMMHRTPKS